MTSDANNVAEQLRQSYEHQILESLVATVREQVILARKLGFVITVETVPNEPLAMGNYGIKVEGRSAPEVYRS